MPADLAVERDGLGLGLNAELAPQDVAAGLELLERRSLALLGRVGTHEDTVGRLAQGIELQEARSRLDAALRVADLVAMRNQFGQRVACQMAQAFTLAPCPALECVLLEAEAVEEIASV